MWHRAIICGVFWGGTRGGDRMYGVSSQTLAYHPYIFDTEATTGCTYCQVTV